MIRKKISINDIAKHLGISKSTVSFVINGKAEERRISRELENRVMEYVKEIDFKPHQLAQSLTTGRSNSIGLIVENIGDSFFGPIALKIEEKAKQHGYRIVYGSTLNSLDAALSVLQLFRDARVDGLIIAPTARMESALEDVLRESLPMIVFDRSARDIQVDYDYVGTNNEEIALQACCHLIAEGFQNIGFITLDSDQSQMTERLSGYHKSMLDANRQPLVFPLPYLKEKSGYKVLIKDIILQNKKLDALFFATNYLCIGGLEAMKESGLSIPDQIGIVVFDDHDLFKLHSPTITAIAQPLEALSEAIINGLMARILSSDHEDAATKTIVPSRLIVRESSILKK